ncbi:MAG: hypothetical protein NUV67_02860, partial [archaeon]|nr:hypothetical protein [archaeon]
MASLDLYFPVAAIVFVIALALVIQRFFLKKVISPVNALYTWVAGFSVLASIFVYWPFGYLTNLLPGHMLFAGFSVLISASPLFRQKMVEGDSRGEMAFFALATTALVSFSSFIEVTEEPLPSTVPEALGLIFGVYILAYSLAIILSREKIYFGAYFDSEISGYPRIFLATFSSIAIL